ncbi:MAG: hypothetical protein IPP19_08375 [Verrucomicrobia bacterium]|nr:hypothetical protein [Verrucomicrobiota bacterium]
MYPQRELIRLNAYKIALQKDIERQRVQCAAVASRVAQPFVLLDRISVLWRKISPFALFAALPLGFLVQRAVVPRVKILGTLMRWSPLVFTIVQRISALVTKPPVVSKNQR